MLGRLLIQKQLTNGAINDTNALAKDWKASFETIDWVNPNTRNLVEDGEFTHSISQSISYLLQIKIEALLSQTSKQIRSTFRRFF